MGAIGSVVMSAEERERLKRRDRRAGLTTELPGEWIETVRNAKAPRPPGSPNSTVLPALPLWKKAQATGHA